MRALPLLLAALPLWAQTRAAAPVEVRVSASAAPVQSPAPAVAPSLAGVPGVLPSLSLPLTPSAARPAGAAASPAAAVPAAAAAVPEARAAVLPASAVPGAAPSANLAPAFAAEPGPDPFSPQAAAAAAAAPAPGDSGGPEGVQEDSGRRTFDGAAAHQDQIPVGEVPAIGYNDLGRLPIQWRDLDARREEYRNLRFVLTEDPAHTKALHDFLRAHPHAFGSILSPMFEGLRSVTESPGFTSRQRVLVAAGFLKRYHETLVAVAKDASLPAGIRDRAYDVLATFLSEWRVVTEMLRAGEVRASADRLAALEARARALDSDEQDDAVPSAPRAVPPPVAVERGWQVLPPRGDRVTVDEVRRGYYSLDSYKDRVDRVAFFLDRLLTRHRLAREKGMRPAFVEARRQEVLEYLREAVTPVRRMTESSLPRYLDVTLGRTWLGTLDDRRPAYIWVPDHPGLRMRSEPGGVVVTARFETDVADAKTAAEFKRSIEEHWRGVFELEGHPVRFRTEVSVRLKPAGAPFSPDALRLVEGEFAHAVPDTIALSKAWSFDVAAHEFGHILGLPDEYSEYYHGPARAGVVETNPGSMMGAHTTGVVQPRHLLAVYRLLSLNSAR